MCERDGFTQSEKGKMFLSKETRLGLRITGEHKYSTSITISFTNSQFVLKA